MADASVPLNGTHREVLAGLGELTRKVRAAQPGTCFPLLLLGALGFGLAATHRPEPGEAVCAPRRPGGRSGRVSRRSTAKVPFSAEEGTF
ncbi:hypothetical protein MUU72_22710 [Streptomyces sp. RS10V-4]|uniref:hypothetical protein n=1 Tax=Streptomyces rhizoryzae TaxID=2932493 RepID=UPI002006B2F8|nr:hypothetical protein [Streptomyces rhizoryzae]MCK7625879.1 hypothetical protein [Streptomyces rhizoryzae]